MKTLYLMFRCKIQIQKFLCFFVVVFFSSFFSENCHGIIKYQPLSLSELIKQMTNW